MKRCCKVCGNAFRRLSDGQHYAFCGVSGLMCRECTASFSSVVATWIQDRADLVERRRLAAQAAAERVEQELAEERLAKASLEALPLARPRQFFWCPPAGGRA